MDEGMARFVRRRLRLVGPVLLVNVLLACGAGSGPKRTVQFVRRGGGSDQLSAWRIVVLFGPPSEVDWWAPPSEGWQAGDNWELRPGQVEVQD
jgi:hypothetical protein